MAPLISSDGEADKHVKKRGKIKMDILVVASLKSVKIEPTKRFAESRFGSPCCMRTSKPYE
jgi:hypothetical protein